MSVHDEYQSEQEITELLRDISGTEKSIRLALLCVMVVALVGSAFGAMWPQ